MSVIRFSVAPKLSPWRAEIIPGVIARRIPTSCAASTTASSNRYISQVLVTPARSISAAPSLIPHRASSAVIWPSRGHMTLVNQSIRGSPSPAPRTKVIGVWAWLLTSPGITRPPSLVVGPGWGGASVSLPIHEIRPLVTSIATSARSEKSLSQVIA